jgi:hypothetical protein
VVLLVDQLGERAARQRVAVEAREAIDVEPEVLEQDGVPRRPRQPGEEPGLPSREGVLGVGLHVEPPCALYE